MTSLFWLIILAAFVAYSLVSGALGRTVLTLPILFAALGYALSETMTAALSPALVGESKWLLAEVTLVLVLFSDASTVRFRRMGRNWRLPARMLIVGMPLTVALGTVATLSLEPSIGFALAMLVAALLTPTDAALGQSVVTSADVPERLSQSINVESGLNDGLALPFVLVGAILAAGLGREVLGGMLVEALGEVILGPLAGVAVGCGVARAMDWAEERDWVVPSAGGVVFLCTAFAAYLLAGAIGGNGFIAAFVAGMAFGNTYRHDIRFIREFVEGEGQILTMASFFAFGALLLPQGLAFASPGAVVLAVLFLTVVRMLPIYLSLAGTGLALREKLFLGWFGPRGLASILFTLIMTERYDLPYEHEVLAIVSLTVGLSILLHGITASPLARWMGRRSPDDPQRPSRAGECS